MFDEFSLSAVPTGRLLTACENHRIVHGEDGREFVALELTAGRLYTTRLAAFPGPHGPVQYPCRLAVYDEAGTFIAGAYGGKQFDDADMLCTFVPRASATHYIEARGCGYSLGAPGPAAPGGAFPESPATADPGNASAHASDLGDLAGIRDSLFPIAHVRGNAEPLGYVRFSLSRHRLVGFGLEFAQGRAELFLEDAGGKPLCGLTHTGSTGEWLSAKLDPGAYFARIRVPAFDAAPFVLRYRAAPSSGHVVQELRRHAERPLDPAARPSSGNGVHGPRGRLDVAPVRVSLGKIPIPSWASSSVRHRLVGGNESGLFELDSVTGELFFTGTEEDMAFGTTDLVLRVRSEEGDRRGACSISLSATRTPVPDQGLPGERVRAPLGPVVPPAPPGAGLRYRITEGNESGLFELEEATGELFFNGTAEQFEEAEGGFDITVKVDAERH